MNLLKTYKTRSDASEVARSFKLLFLMMLFFTSGYAGQYKKIIKVTTKDNMLILAVNNNNKLIQLYYGNTFTDDLSKLDIASENNEVYAPFGINTSTASIGITHADGNTTTDLNFQDYTVRKIDENTDETVIALKDSYYPLGIKLYYRTYRNENVIERWTEISQSEKGPVVLFDVASESLYVKASKYHVTHFNGNWTNEFNTYETTLNPGIFTMDAKEGIRTSYRTNPSFLLSLNKTLEENNGEVIGGTLAWPGNWQIQFNVDDQQKLKISAGINPYAAPYVLNPKTVFKTPSFIYSFSSNGAGEISRRFHRWARKYGVHDGNGERYVLLNNWEATGMDFDENKISKLIKQTADFGFDLFLLDDGWFGNKHPRNDDHAGLGDWSVNKKKLPHGIDYLVKTAEQNQVKFGIWIEPEMVNRKSELFEKHPDWVLAAPNRPFNEQRNQLVLDLSNPKVQQYILNTLDSLVGNHKGLAYLKWDCNRLLTNTWSNYLGKGKQSNLYYDYTRGLLQILETFRVKYPDISLMVCASGGGRLDYGSLRYFNESWPSDNTDPHARVMIQWGMGHIFPAAVMASHVSHMGNQNSLKFKFDVAMSGKLGMDMQPEDLNAEDQAFAKKAIQTYKEVKDVVLKGDLYRLLSPYKTNRASVMYVAEDQKKALVFSYQVKGINGGDHTKTILDGLNPEALYKLTELNKVNYSRLNDYEGKVFTGKYLMSNGLSFSMWGQDESNVILLTTQ